LASKETVVVFAGVRALACDAGRIADRAISPLRILDLIVNLHLGAYFLYHNWQESYQ